VVDLYVKCVRCGAVEQARKVGPVVRLPPKWAKIRGHVVCAKCMVLVEDFLKYPQRWPQTRGGGTP